MNKNIFVNKVVAKVVKNPEEDKIRVELIKFFHQNPKDSEVNTLAHKLIHSLAKELNIETSKVEGVVFNLIAKAFRSLQ